MALANVIRDPVRFAGGILGEQPWRRQRDIMRSVASKPGSNTAVKACHASGKTRCAADVALWWLQRYEGNCKVITTAPTFRQVKLIWSEIAILAQRSRIPYPPPTKTGIQFTEEHYAVGISTDEPTKMQGYHGDHVLIIVDEATGVLASLFDAIEGIRAGGDVRLLLLGNPTVPGGKFYDAFTRDRAIWNLFTISAFDTPNFEGVDEAALLAMDQDELGRAKLRFMVNRAWVREKHKTWGVDHPMYRARVLGEFPTQSDLSVFSLAWIERASLDPPEIPQDGRRRVIQIGVDVAGPGDDETSLCARVGGVIIHQESWPDRDPRGKLTNAINKLHQTPGCVIGPVVVDTVGIGYYLARGLADQGLKVYNFNAGGKPMNPEKFVNAKAECYWALREWLELDRVKGLEDEETRAQLSGIRYRHTANGRIEIEPKDEAKKRGQQSPDRAEAVTLAFCYLTPEDVSVEFGGVTQISPI